MVHGSGVDLDDMSHQVRGTLTLSQISAATLNTKSSTSTDAREQTDRTTSIAARKELSQGMQ